jgi:hypothetical protein
MNVKEAVDFASMILNLQATLKSLQGADTEQKEKIQVCIEQLKVLAAVVHGQEHRLSLLERRASTMRLGETVYRHAQQEPDPTAPLLAAPTKKSKRTLKGA